MKEAESLWSFIGFPLTLFVTGTVTSQLSMQQGRKHGIQSAKAVVVTFCSHFVYLNARLGDFYQSRIVSITLLTYLNKREIK